MSEGVVCVSDDAEILARVRQALGGLPEEERAALRQQGAVIDARVAARRYAEVVSSRANIAVIGERHRMESWSLLRQANIRHLIWRATPWLPRTWRWWSTLGGTAQVVGPDSGGVLTTCLGHGASLTQFSVNTASKARCLDAIAADMRVLRLRRQPVTGVQSVLDELLMNALIDAPAVAARDAVMSETTARDVTVTWGYDADYVGVAVRDRYGVLTKAAVVDSITGAMGRGGAPLMREHGGAGIGLYLVASQASHLVVHVKPGEFTEVACVFVREPLGRGGSVHFTRDTPAE